MPITARLLCAASAALLAVSCAERRIAGPNGGLRHVSGPMSAPPPEVVEAWAARHPPCIISASPSPTWVERRLRGSAVSFRLPPNYSEHPDFAPAEKMQAWISSDSTLFTIGVSEGGQFNISGDSATTHIDQRTCSMRIAGRLSLVALYVLVGDRGADTLYVATADAAVRPELWIGAGAVSRSAEKRDQVLASLSTIHIVEP